MGFTCSECFLALAYDPRDLNLFKVVGSDEVIEYLDIEKPEAASELTQAVSCVSLSRLEPTQLTLYFGVVIVGCPGREEIRGCFDHS